MRRPEQQDPWDDALQGLLQGRYGAGDPDSPQPPRPTARTAAAAVNRGAAEARRPPAAESRGSVAVPRRQLGLSATLLLAAGWLLVLPVALAAPPTISSSVSGVLTVVAVLGVLTVFAALLGRWRSAPFSSAVTATALVGVGGLEPSSLLAAAVLLPVSVAAVALDRR